MGQLAIGRDGYEGQGPWEYSYQAVDKAGSTADFLLTAKRDRKVASRFLRKTKAIMVRPKRSPQTRSAPTRRSDSTMLAMDHHKIANSPKTPIRRSKIEAVIAIGRMAL